ncbi:2-oxoglutarate-dependent dioxygenase, partial [Rhodanobacter denitrificans]|nr:2-oxoglutarate-dependent dioxygenase [Rhodanobacter denitrificans]
MHPRTAISPELREWILATTRAGHGVPEVLRLLKENGYDPRQSRSIVAEVLKLP